MIKSFDYDLVLYFNNVFENRLQQMEMKQNKGRKNEDIVV